ncbi:hypothetical protein ACPW96_11790 [Micromonospora sp. DT81.3]|uniref:hypothetical protein n=1 Tax=Micromonospora sp. DT81.3 TaxID=3416523 RepID=UPI003CEFBAAA
MAKQAGYANAPNAVRAVRSYAGSLPKSTHDELRAMMRARSEAVWQQAFADVLQQRPGAVRAGFEGAHFQDVKHSSLTTAARAGASLRELMDRAGHKTSRAALIY